ncbi:MAG: hypothetical protein NW223_05730 [Hyphomicrobiaceae bacterium]|nr:hypothetical protein [Hyphomicrobiaceae bacterium]
MLKQSRNHALEREMALAEGLRDVASELRLIEAADLIAFIRTEQFGNIANLVASSTEFYFLPGTVRFGQSGDIDVRWGGTPVVNLDMEFKHQGVNVFFRLRLEALQAGVEITYVSFEDSAADPSDNTRRLVEAIQDARVSPIRAAAASPSQDGARA